MRVHISLAPTPAPTALPRLPCAEECSNSEDEGTGESPALSQQLSDKQQVDNASSGITSGEPQKEDMMFLENTVAVNILVERAMHLSLKGKISHTHPFSSFFLAFLFSFFVFCFVFLCDLFLLQQSEWQGRILSLGLWCRNPSHCVSTGKARG